MPIKKFCAASDSAATIPQNMDRRYTLSELLTRCDPDLPLTEEEQAWVDAPAVGLEAFALLAIQP